MSWRGALNIDKMSISTGWSTTDNILVLIAVAVSWSV